ncbi:MAG TPA: ABC transporter substrate-binding protein [Polyangiaceae bacterium]
MNFSIRSFLAVLTLALTMSTAATALAQTPDEFVRTGHAQLDGLLRQPASAQRDAQIAATFDQMVDYNELVRRCFKEHWGELDAAKQAEVSELLRQIVRKNYQKNLKRTLNYDVTYTGTRGQGSDVLVRTEAHSKVSPRDPVVSIDYVVQGPAAGPFRVVDILTEHSSLTTNYYRDFHRFLTTAGQGYPYLVEKLRNKIVQLDSQH